LDEELQELRRRVAESPRDESARERLASALERSGEALEATQHAFTGRSMT
jgi:hypothetical protein